MLGLVLAPPPTVCVLLSSIFAWTGSSGKISWPGILTSDANPWQSVKPGLANTNGGWWFSIKILLDRAEPHCSGF